MLKPAIEPRRTRGPRLMVSIAFVSGALVGVGGAVAGFMLGSPRVVVVQVAPAQLAPPDRSQALTARVSRKAMDVMSPDAYQPDGAPDEVFEVELTAPLGVQHIFLNGNGGSHQWDTVIGADPIPFGRVFGGHRGDTTWHLAVLENATLMTSSRTGALPPLAPGAHHLELVATGVADGPGPRTVTVMFVDGTTLTAVVGF